MADGKEDKSKVHKLSLKGMDLWMLMVWHYRC